MRKNISRFVAFVLLLVFFQKVCGQLWLHNWLHTGNKACYAYAAGKVINQEQLRCSCLDDFFLPYTQPDPQVAINLPAVYTVHKQEQLACFISAPSLYSSLRAPPVM